jgi:predicted acetyltransferase
LTYPWKNALPLFEPTHYFNSKKKIIWRKLILLQAASPGKKAYFMENLRLIKPNIDFEKEYSEMLTDWKVNDEKHIPWFINCDSADFEAMVKRLEGLSQGIGVDNGLVDNSTYWLINDHREIIGAINIRHRLNDFFLNYGGQIGYGVRPSERRKGYAKEMLRMGLEICRNMGFEKILICCNKENMGSIKTIMKNGGVLASEGIFNGEEMQRYWIALI